MTYFARTILKAGLVLGAGLAMAIPAHALAGDVAPGYYAPNGYTCHDRKVDNATGGAVAGTIIGGAAGGVPGAFVGAVVGGSAAADNTRCYRSNVYVYDDSDPRTNDPSYRDPAYRGDSADSSDAYRQGYRDGYRDHYRLQYDYSYDR